jgi:hypothetical protein
MKSGIECKAGSVCSSCAMDDDELLLGAAGASGGEELLAQVHPSSRSHLSEPMLSAESETAASVRGSPLRGVSVSPGPAGGSTEGVFQSGGHPWGLTGFDQAHIHRQQSGSLQPACLSADQMGYGLAWGAQGKAAASLCEPCLQGTGPALSGASARGLTAESEAQGPAAGGDWGSDSGGAGEEEVGRQLQQQQQQQGARVLPGRQQGAGALACHSSDRGSGGEGEEEEEEGSGCWGSASEDGGDCERQHHQQQQQHLESEAWLPRDETTGGNSEAALHPPAHQRSASA